MFLKRIGSSLADGRNTGHKMLNERRKVGQLSEGDDVEVENRDSQLKSLIQEEYNLLKRFVEALDLNEAIDPKYYKTVELLRDKKWLNKGAIIFSHYFDIARWVVDKLSKEFVMYQLLCMQGK